MEKTQVFFAAVLAAPLIGMWMKIFLFHEVALVLPLVAYFFFLISMVDQILQVKATTMDKGNQTETRAVKDQSVQTEDLWAIQSEEDPEMELGLSLVQTVEGSELEIHRPCRKHWNTSETSTESEENSTSDSEPIQELSSQPFTYLPGVEVTEKESSFVAKSDPTSFDYESETSEISPVAEWYLQYIEKKRAKKQRVPFYRRKVKIPKLFRKKKNKTS